MQPWNPGLIKYRSSLHDDIVDLMLATGARIGEILAMRWQDLDLAVENPTLTISGTIVYLKGKGFFRQGWPKNKAGYRTVVVPRFAVGMVMARTVIMGRPRPRGWRWQRPTPLPKRRT